MTMAEDFSVIWTAYENNAIGLTELGHWLRVHHEQIKAALGTPSETAFTVKGEKSRAAYSPSRVIAQDGDQHLYIFHNGLWYHFAPKGWKEPQRG